MDVNVNEIKEIHTQVQAINEKLDALIAQQTKMEAQFTSARDDIQAQLDYFAQKLGQHDRDLYVLKRRQTDKEAAR